MPKLSALGDLVPVRIIDHEPDGIVVVELTRVRSIMRVQAHHLVADDGEDPRMFEQRDVPSLSASQLAVLDALHRAGGFGMTDDEHEAVNGLRADSAGKRRLELQRLLYVADTGDVRPTRRGVRARVWRITTAGGHALRAAHHPDL